MLTLVWFWYPSPTKLKGVLLSLRRNKTKTIMDIPPKINLAYFHSTRPPVIPHLQFRFREFHNAMHDDSLFHGRL